MTKRIIKLLICAFIVGCNIQKDDVFYRELQVKDYLRNHHNLTINKPTVCIFLIGTYTGCRPCEERKIELLDSLLNINRFSLFDKYAILSNNNSHINKEFKFLNFKNLIDKQNNLQKNGLDMPYNFIIQYDEHFNIVFWEWLVDSKYDLIYTHFSKNDLHN